MKTILAFIVSSMIFFIGCASVQTHYDSATGIHQIHAYDNSVLNTSSKLSQYLQCDLGKENPENCKPMGSYHSDTTGLVPSVGGQSLQGIAIGVGLSEYNNSNSSGGVVDNSCRGNCGGNPK